MKRKATKKATAPPQITLGGVIGRKVWDKHIMPLVRDTHKSTREVAELLGVSHQTVHRWRSAYA